jgi:hypothetical protein
MKSLGIFMRLISVTAAVALVLSSGCGSDPVSPSGADSYPVYLGSPSSNWFWKYDPSKGILDSFHLPVNSFTSPVISADGKSMYLTTESGFDTTVVMLDLATLDTTTIWHGQRNWYLAVSPDNRLLALCGRDLNILNTSDYSVAFHDTTAVLRGAFSDSSQAFYGGYGEAALDGGMRVDLKTGSILRKVFSGHIINRIIPSHDEERWYLYFNDWPDASSFAVYDVASDSIIFRDISDAGHGDIRRTLSDRYVLYSFPGDPFFGPNGSSELRVYDPGPNSVVARIDVSGRYGEDTLFVTPCPDQLAITPDSRWLVGTVVAPWAGWFTLDIETLQISKRESFGATRVFIGFNICQNGR